MQRRTVNSRPDTAERLEPIELPENFAPRYIVTVDTEEEFDWSAPFTRDRHGTETVAQIPRFQDFCAGFGVRPIYLVDWPIIDDDDAVRILRDCLEGGAAAVGIQLHVWVNPPFEEEISDYNSYAANLPPGLKREKLTRLHDAIAERTGRKPLIYRSGRYGAGPALPDILRDLGVRIDSSVRSLFDYSDTGGPDYSRRPLHPYWLEPGELAELPLTSVFAGLLGPYGETLYPLAEKLPAARGALARLGLLERVALTPEGIPAEKAIEAIDIALDRGLPILNFSFHSPSLAPGHTPYVRSDADLRDFYRWWERLFEHCRERGVRPASLDELIAAIFG